MKIDVQTLEQRDQLDVRHDTSWLDAPPILIVPQLRNTGRLPAGSASRRIIDRAAERAAIKRRLDMESSRDESSRETLIALGRIRLSEVGGLDADTFHLLMELIERAAPKPGDRRQVDAKSRDGNLRITVAPVSEQPTLAVLGTEAGELRTQDMWLEVSRAG